MIVEAVLSAVVILSLCLYVKIFTRPKSFPPGPVPLPIIGNMHLLGYRPYLACKEMSRKYGDVFSLFFGGWNVVIVNSIEAARESLIQKAADFAGRPPSIIGGLFARGEKDDRGIDILFSDYGPYWRTIRKISHHALKLYGHNRENLEQVIKIHSRQLIERIEQKKGAKFYPRKDLCLTATNVICTLVFGSTYDIEDEEFETIVHYTAIVGDSLAGGRSVDFFQWLRYFPIKALKATKEFVRLRDPLILKKIKEHQESYQEGKIRDLTDALLSGAKQEMADDATTVKYLGDDNILMIVNDVFNAAIDTTTTTFDWFIVYSVLYPETQKKLHAQIDSEIGRSRLPNLEDRHTLQYLEAAIHETLRLATVAPFTFAHNTTCDTTLAGYKLPKDTRVFYNIHAINHDERHWENPEEFKPERWLDDHGVFIRKLNDSYLSFSAGKRVCFGQALAKMELFVVLAQVYQRFEFVPADGEPLPQLNGRVSITHEPFPYKICARKRF